MNEYQEALDDLWNGCPNPKEQVKSKEILQELVDKGTPRKVTHQATLSCCCTCPNCLNVVDKFEENYLGRRVRVIYDYCIFCGQHLDWSDTND